MRSSREADMSQVEPSLGRESKEQAEHPNGRSRGLSLTAAALDILSCLDSSRRAAEDLGPPRDASEIARLTRLPRLIVCEQLTRLAQHGYVEEAAYQRYRLPAEARGLSEIVISSVRHSSLTRPRRQTLGEEDATGSSR
jgi:DNA-binding IclR family transcriptional regulator